MNPVASQQIPAPLTTAQETLLQQLVATGDRRACNQELKDCWAKARAAGPDTDGERLALAVLDRLSALMLARWPHRIPEVYKSRRSVERAADEKRERRRKVYQE